MTLQPFATDSASQVFHQGVVTIVINTQLICYFSARPAHPVKSDKSDVQMQDVFSCITVVHFARSDINILGYNE